MGDVWELLELVLDYWAERVCAVAAGNAVSNAQAVESVKASTEMEFMLAT